MKSLRLFRVGFSSLIKSIYKKKKRQSSLFWHLLKIIKFRANSFGDMLYWSLRWFPIAGRNVVALYHWFLSQNITEIFIIFYYFITEISWGHFYSTWQFYWPLCKCRVSQMHKRLFWIHRFNFVNIFTVSIWVWVWEKDSVQRGLTQSRILYK